MLGVGSILRNTPAGRDFLDAVRFVFERMPPVRRSVIVSSLTAAIHGAFGRTIVHDKTVDRPPWLSPLTQLIWYFEADNVARMKLYYEGAKRAASLRDLGEVIETARERAGVKRRVPIPI